jgi:hypothetical protein
MNMLGAIGTLEKRVVAAADLIASLRGTVERLTRELERSGSDPQTRAVQAPPPLPDPSLVEELERLRAERVMIRDSIRRLLREIDQVSW